VVAYWYWLDPRDGQEKSLQCPGDKATAIRRAKELNAIVAREMADTVVESLAGSPAKRKAGVAFDVYAAHCLTLWANRGFAANTLRSRKSLVNAAIAAFKSEPLHLIGVPAVVKAIRHYTDQGKDRLAQSLRSTISDIFTEAYQEGILTAGHPNPAKIARRPEAKVRRSRLTLEAFIEIRERAVAMADTRGAWIENSMLLGLSTGQRREDLAMAQFRRGKDWQKLWDAFQEGGSAAPYPFVEDGYFWVVQQKTRALVRIPLSLRIDAIGLSVGDVIDRCRSTVASRYLLHHTVPFGNAALGSCVHKDTVSRAFADARNATDLEWPGKTPPTFHELRSLCERLYREQGVDTQALLGHKHAKMTEVYADLRQAAWVTVSGN